MSDTITKLKEDGWGNCNKRTCGYFFKKSVLEFCPACHHPRHEPDTYTQPAYEPPTLS